MNPITDLLVVFAFLGAAALLGFILALARAEDGYQDENGYHRVTPRSSAVPFASWRPILRPQRVIRNTRAPIEEPASRS